MTADVLDSSLVFGSFIFHERETAAVPLGPGAGDATEHKRVTGLVPRSPGSSTWLLDAEGGRFFPVCIIRGAS
jgi:hypothetical protein